MEAEGESRAVPSPIAEYSQRLDARRAEQRRWSQTDARIASLRLAVFGLGILLAVAAVRGSVPVWILLGPVVTFALLMKGHDIALQRRTAAARGVAFYQHGIARIEDVWVGTGEPGDRFRDDHHLFANDLDLFGNGSLFQLLSIASTHTGEETLAMWLKHPANPDEIRLRQAAVAELTPALDLRESLGRVALDVRAGMHSASLLTWAEDPPSLAPHWLAWIARGFTALVFAALAWLAVTDDVNPLLVVLAAQSLFAFPQMRRIVRVLHRAETATRDLGTLSRLVERIEVETFASPRLRHIQQRLRTGSLSASKAIRTLRRLVEIHDWQHNNVFLALSLPFMLGMHLAWAMESWRRRNGAAVRQWLAAAGEFEALASLSAYRYEHPDDPFPDLLPGEGRRACFEGTGLGHPLLPASRIVRNDVSLDDVTRLLVVSGSNMSGKSTLLRTVGANAVLAFTGAPVRAASLRLSPLTLGATLRIQDSLLEGRSRFYAEITRIRELADAARGPQPLLFLLDELFHGTNSHDRLVGASGVLKSLLDRGSIGLITTHDLALTAIADDLGGHAANVHFEEWFDAGEMRFDYRLKPGRVTRSNALALMRAVGLEVDADG
jgi:hypothetical protein